MNVCLNCAKFGACKLASENIKYCENFQKRNYEVKIERKNNGIYQNNRKANKKM